MDLSAASSERRAPAAGGAAGTDVLTLAALAAVVLAGEDDDRVGTFQRIRVGPGEKDRAAGTVQEQQGDERRDRGVHEVALSAPHLLHAKAPAAGPRTQLGRSSVPKVSNTS